ncbi:MAG: NAD-dependent epimerase/dehydratase family protein, partial [Betaproteobacteria bacterium]|nr:NAD-dependent epimerase/dehydratase family protein [Betaproteobacteria bacterium]
MVRRVLVLGATGFTGLSVVNGLLDAGYRVLALSRTAYRLPVRDGLLPIAQPLENVDAYRPELASCDAVFHLASDSTPGSTANQPALDASLNLLPALQLLEAMQAFPNTPLIFLSSGGATYAPSQTEVLSESAPVAPVSNYGAGKLAIEQFIGAHVRKHRARAVAVRGANFYGAGQSYRAGFGVVPTIFRRMRDGVPMTIWGDGGHVRDYLYIDDLVALCVLLIDATPTQGDFRILNAGTGVGT